MTRRTWPVRRALLALLAAAATGMTPALASVAAPAGEVLAGPADPSAPRPDPYPRQVELTEPPEDPGDAALRLGLAAYHSLAPRLNDLQERSERVSVEVVGTSVTGRELYLVTLTEPETAAEVARQGAMRRQITDRPAQAAGDAATARDYKLPVFISANIHGDEWEGTDAALRLVEEYATSADPAVAGALASMRIHLLLTANPDGRVAGTRANAAGFDLNRDLVTASQPEVVALRDAIVRTQPVLLLDLHGYVNGTLIDPSTAPHGENYEYDLFLRHAWPNALGIEAAVENLGYDRADGVNPPQIPLRDWRQGWDDWPPIFTPQYAALHGAVAHTVEMPLRVNQHDHHRSAEELRRRARINTDVAHAALLASLGYALDHRAELLADHTEVARRGAAGEDPRPPSGPGAEHVTAEDLVLTDYPRGYLIPTGPDQRSQVAAARLVGHLLANGVEVQRLASSFHVGGVTYPAQTYVVDLHQARRGMARALLGPGSDLSDRVHRMYDVSGWSHALLWGAEVATVPAGSALPPTTGPLVGAEATGSVAGPGDLVLRLDDPADLVALNTLLGAGAEVRLLEDGSAVVDERHRHEAEDLAVELGVSFGATPAAGAGTAVTPITVAAIADPEDTWALREMGFEVVPVDARTLNAGFDWAGIDVLYAARPLGPSALDARAWEALRSFLDSRGGLVGQGGPGAALNATLDLLEVRSVSGTAEANGVVAVEVSTGPIAHRAPEHTFVEAPVWFRGLGDGVRVDQRLDSEDVLVSGHWRATAGGGGPDAAAGQALVVSGVDDAGAGVVLFGSDPLFRAHPKGQYPLVGRALHWVAAQRS